MDIPVQFSGHITVDAPISKNDEGIRLASQLIPSENERTFPFAGVVTDSISGDEEVLSTTKPLTPEQCAKLTKQTTGSNSPLFVTSKAIDQTTPPH